LETMCLSHGTDPQTRKLNRIIFKA
jgi:hypothetical protein